MKVLAKEITHIPASAPEDEHHIYLRMAYRDFMKKHPEFLEGVHNWQSVVTRHANGSGTIVIQVVKASPFLDRISNLEWWARLIAIALLVQGLHWLLHYII